MYHINIRKSVRCRGFGLFLSIIPFLIALITAGNALADLPSAEEIMMKNVEALGGEAALARHHNSLMKGKLSVSGVEMEATIYSAAPNLRYSLFESAMIGKMESGCNGEAAWDLSDMQGASVKEGKELEKGLFDAAFNAEMHWRDRYKRIDVKAEKEIEGRACYEVVLTPIVGDSVTAYIDKETWLTLRTETVDNSNMGSISIVSDLSDYREVDGVKVPFRIKLLVMGAQEIMTTMESVEFNVEIPEGVFDLPVEIQQILDAEQPKAED